MRPLRLFSRLLLAVCLALGLGPCSLVLGDGMDWVPPDDWPAAKRVNAFLQAYLENCILAPLDSPAAPPRVPLSALGIDFAAHLQAADTPTERALYNNAAGVCDLLGRLLDERDTAQAALFNAQSGGFAVNPLDRPAYGTSGHYSWNLERERKRAQNRQEHQARLNSLDKKSLFVTSQLQNWAARTVRYRQVVQQAAVNVMASQIRFDRAELASAPQPPAAIAQPPGPPVPVPAPAPAAVVAPAVAAVPPASATPLPDWPDPAIGRWRHEGDPAFTLGANWMIFDGRSGYWKYSCTTDGGRNYELHWAGKPWVDYMILSSDGKSMIGKGRANHVAWYSRQ